MNSEKAEVDTDSQKISEKSSDDKELLHWADSTARKIIEEKGDKEEDDLFA